MPTRKQPIKTKEELEKELVMVREAVARLIDRLGRDAAPYVRLMIKAFQYRKNSSQFGIGSRKIRGQRRRFWKWMHALMRNNRKIERIWKKHPAKE